MDALPEEVAMFTMEDITTSLGPAFDAEHLCTAISVVLDYLNDSNECEELEIIRSRAKLWCLDYFKTELFERRKLDIVLKEHPRLFNLNIPSLLRLDTGGEIDASSESQDQDEEDENGLTKFPSYCEHVLFDDVLLFRILELYDQRQGEEEGEQGKARLAHSDATTTGGCFNIRLTARHLWGSPIAFYIPEVMCHLALLNLCELHRPESESSDDGFLSSSTNNTSEEEEEGDEEEEEEEKNAAAHKIENDEREALTNRHGKLSYVEESRVEPPIQGRLWPIISSIGKLATGLPLNSRFWTRSNARDHTKCRESSLGFNAIDIVHQEQAEFTTEDKITSV